MQIKWFGHSCFQLESKEGVKIVTDPFDEQVGYDIPDVKADIVTISHNHFDHNNLEIIEDGYALVKDTGKHSIRGITVEGFDTYHDEAMGAKRGSNIVYKYYIDDYTVCHLGDLGHMLDNNQLEEIKNVDVLLVPIGGTFTINSEQANDLVNSISPNLIVPMHYKTNKLAFDLEPIDNFAKYFKNIEYIDGNEIELTDELLSGHKEVIVLNYE